jgi:hypothetical protein
MVDLHGLYVAEAVEYAKEELRSATYRNDNAVSFIVGMCLSFNGPYALNGLLRSLFHVQARGCTPKTVCRNFGQHWKNSSMSTWASFISRCFGLLTPVDF